tara:strand:+ start:416 stop:949 length:534 start_codon:yes stop_codon:yes gene_type:complete
MPRSVNKLLIENIYTNIVKTSRNKIFFLNFKVDDTVEGRFDIIILHSFIIFYFFIKLGDKKSKLPQLLFDCMFTDFDSNLREMGFGDIAVNKRMKQFIKAFYGRISNYSKGLAQYKKLNNDNILKDTIIKNIYKDINLEVKCVNFWSDYIINNVDYINNKTLDQNIDDHFDFKQLDI